MKTALFSGVCTALVTPFLDGRVNYPMVEQLLRLQIDAGIPAVVVCGTTGESPTLTDEEKLTLFYRCKEYAGDSCKIIAGTGSNSTAHAIELSVAAQEAGADGLLIVSPYYNKATPKGLIAHYAAIAQRVSLPIILYNVPGRTGVDMPVSVYRQLSAIPNVVGVKEASADITKILRILAACPPDFSVWSGNDDQTVPVMALGGKGIISVLSNVLPEKMLAMTRAAEAGNYTAAAALQKQLLPLTDALFSEVNPIPVKEAMKRIGFDCGNCRLPLTSISEENGQKLSDALKHIR